MLRKTRMTRKRGSTRDLNKSVPTMAKTRMVILTVKEVNNQLLNESLKRSRYTGTKAETIIRVTAIILVV